MYSKLSALFLSLKNFLKDFISRKFFLESTSMSIVLGVLIF